jgi:hypothetical protein
MFQNYGMLECCNCHYFCNFKMFQNVFIILSVVTACSNVATALINETVPLNPDLTRFSFFLEFFSARGFAQPPISMSICSEYSSIYIYRYILSIHSDVVGGEQGHPGHVGH